MSRCLKRLTNKALEFRFGFQFPPLFHLFNQSANFIFSLLRRSLFKSMDSLFFSTNDDDYLFSNSFDQSFLPPSFADPGDSLYLVSFRWWKEAACGGAVVDDTTAVLYDATAQLNGGVGDQSIGGSEILVGLRRQDEAGISGDEGNHGGEGDLALLSEWMFFTSLKWLGYVLILIYWLIYIIFFLTSYYWYRKNFVSLASEVENHIYVGATLQLF